MLKKFFDLILIKPLLMISSQSFVESPLCASGGELEQEKSNSTYFILSRENYCFNSIENLSNVEWISILVAFCYLFSPVITSFASQSSLLEIISQNKDQIEIAMKEEILVSLSDIEIHGDIQVCIDTENPTIVVELQQGNPEIELPQQTIELEGINFEIMIYVDPVQPGQLVAWNLNVYEIIENSMHNAIAAFVEILI